MNDLQPYVVDLAQVANPDDAWRIEFKYDNGRRMVWIDNVARPLAFYVYDRWSNSPGDGELVSCKQCPESTSSNCPHGVPIWKYAEMTDMRVMPMREAV